MVSVTVYRVVPNGTWKNNSYSTWVTGLYNHGDDHLIIHQSLTWRENTHTRCSLKVSLTVHILPSIIIGFSYWWFESLSIPVSRLKILWFLSLYYVVFYLLFCLYFCTLCWPAGPTAYHGWNKQEKCDGLG